MQRRFTAFFIIFAFILVSMQGIGFSKEIVIKDVSKDDADYEKIAWVINQGYMNLVSGKFLPNTYVRRRDFAQILCKLSGDISNLANPVKPTFIDVSKKDPSYRYIETVKNYMTYYKSSKGVYFKPNSYLTREDAVYSIVKLLGLNSEEALTSGNDIDISLDDVIDDYKSVSPSMVKYVSLAIANELIELREADNKVFFDPKKNITRKDLAVFIYNAYQLKNYNLNDEELNEDNQTDTEEVIAE